MNKIHLNALFTIAIIFIPSHSFGREFSYEYVEFVYRSTAFYSNETIDAFEIKNSDSLGIAGSYGINSFIAFTAGYEASSINLTNQDDNAATSEITLGVTAHTPITSRLDVYGNVSLLKANIKHSSIASSADNTDTGNIISIGARYLVAKEVELEARFLRADVFDNSSNAFGIGARFYANDRFYASNKFSLGIAYAKGDDSDTLLIVGRMDFK